MAINTELPISKVTFDDQEISLASSGGGGEEVKQETYAGSQIATCYAKIRELAESGKLSHVKLKTTATISLSGGLRYEIKSGSLTKNTYSDSISAERYLILNPSFVGSSSVHLTTSYETKNAICTINSSSLRFVFHSVYGADNLLNIYDMNTTFDLNSFELELFYFA
jgi:hypothetical protein